MFEALKSRDGKKFLLAVAIVFIAAVSVVSKVTFQGVEDQYNLPMADWTAGMYVMQGAWVAVYSIVFTILGSIPFGFYFLGPKDDRG